MAQAVGQSLEDPNNPDKYLIVILLGVMVVFIIRTLIKFQKGVTVDDGPGKAEDEDEDDEASEDEDKQD